jgi:copper resistance protein B
MRVLSGLVTLGVLFGWITPPASAHTLEAEFDLAEYHLDRDKTLFLDGAVSIGGDRDRIVAKLTTGGRVGDHIDEIDGQFLYSRTLGSNVAVLVGLRHEFRPNPYRTYGTLGMEAELFDGLAAESYFFLSEKGVLTGELKAVYDVPVTERWTLQPRAVLGLAARDAVTEGLGYGATGVEVGVRLRFELSDLFAPYVGISHDRLLGRTADLARDELEDVRATHAIVGFSSTF